MVVRPYLEAVTANAQSAQEHRGVRAIRLFWLAEPGGAFTGHESGQQSGQNLGHFHSVHSPIAMSLLAL